MEKRNDVLVVFVCFFLVIIFFGVFNSFKKYSAKCKEKEQMLMEKIAILENSRSCYNAKWGENSDNPITVCLGDSLYLDDNGITVKAKSCAMAGGYYPWEGDSWYIAKDKADLKKKLFDENYPANRIVTSKVTDMSYLFNDVHFNQDIGNWDTSNVTNMVSMFNGNKGFEYRLDNWDVSNVKDFANIFENSSFNKANIKSNSKNSFCQKNLFKYVLDYGTMLDYGNRFCS